MGLRFKLSYTRNGPVPDEIRRILVHEQHNQSGVINKPIKRPCYTTQVSQIPFLQNRRTFATQTPDRLNAVTAASACRKANIKAIVYPKRFSTRRDTPYPGALAEYSNRCPKYRCLQNRCHKHIVYDTAERPRRPPRIGETLSRLLFRATIGAIIYPKRSSTRRNTPYPGAPAA